MDDGLLTASEVAQLKLNADWVILSACNTAAADGTPGARGLSGLAKAFADDGICCRDAGRYLDMVISQRLCLLLYPASCLPLLVASR